MTFRDSHSPIWREPTDFEYALGRAKRALGIARTAASLLPGDTNPADLIGDLKLADLYLQDAIAFASK